MTLILSKQLRPEPQATAHYGKYVEQGDHYNIADRNENFYNHFGNQDPAIQLSIYPKDALLSHKVYLFSCAHSSFNFNSHKLQIF